MDDPTDRHWGYDLGKRAGVRSGVLYPVLRRMLEAGWLVDGWESADEVAGRPPRRYYELSGEGFQHFKDELAVAQTDPRVRPAINTGVL